MRYRTIITAMLMATLGLQAQKQFTLEDLNFGGNNYHNMSPKNRHLTWWGDKLIELDTDGCRIVTTEKGETDAEDDLMRTDDLNAWADCNDSVKIYHLYQALFPYADKPQILVTTKSERLLIDFEKHEVVWRQPCADEEIAEWNAASKATAFVKDWQLYVIDSIGTTVQLTTDGSRDIVYGKAVHRNEFGIMKGTFWSNDGQRLAFYRMDQSMVTDYPQVNTFTDIATHEPDKYPMAGTASHKVTIGIYNLGNGQTVYLDTGDTTDHYLTNIAWAPDSKTIYLQELNRDQNHMRLTSYDAETGRLTAVIYEEEHSKYVEPLHPIMFLPWDNTKFILQSQRDGYNHLFLFDTSKPASTRHTTLFGTTCTERMDVRQLTSGSFVVQELVAFNTQMRSIIIRSNEISPIQSNIFSVDVTTKRRTLIDNGRGTHRPTANIDGTMLYDKYSEPDVPRNIDVINTTSLNRYTAFEAPDPWQGYGVPKYKVGTIKADDDSTDLYYRIVTPVDFDPSKKYPAILYVYGGPHSHMIEAGWHYLSRSWDTYMAQKGYVVFTLDNRGSDNRGLAFEQVTFRRLGQTEMKDQMRGVDYLLSLPFVDRDRIGVHGWSYGGFMTISLMTNYPDVFKVGVAGGPVIDWKWYEVMYGERYMDTPESNPEGYAETSLLNKAADLKGRLQIIIGMNDDTVVPQHALQFIDACTEAGTQPDLFVYPGEGHNMLGHKSVHLHERITQYFEDFLKNSHANSE